jgi:uncharacterized glyoxalase superfamily protein PhnB
MDRDLRFGFNFNGSNPTAQLSAITSDMTASVVADVSIEVDNFEELYARAIELGLSIAHPITTEPWGVRRFLFVTQMATL